MGQLLLIEDDDDAILIVKRALLHEHQIQVCQTLKEAHLALGVQAFHLILLDVVLPDGNGFEFLSALRLPPLLNSTPVLFITGKSDVSDQVLAFSLGAEDYLVKPIHPMLLQARINAKLKKNNLLETQSEIFVWGEFKFDLLNQHFFLLNTNEEVHISLTPIEFKLLLSLAQNANQMVSRKVLMSTVWGSNIHVIGRTLDTHICHLRAKIKSSKFKIESNPGLGYRLVASSNDKASTSK